MPNQTYQIPNSKSTLEFTLPPGIQATVAVSRPAKPLQDVSEVIQEALNQPIETQPLRKMANPGDSACIVFKDVIRASPDHQLVPALLRKLEIAGIRDEDITLLYGVGMHRPSTKEDKNTKLRADIAARYRVIDSKPQNPDALVDLGIMPGACPSFCIVLW